MATLGRAIEIAAAAHAEQYDKGGKPYILHPIWVMNKVRHLGEEYMIVAILHDVVEDTKWTIEKLREEGFSENILVALALLDYRGKDYLTHTEKVGFNEIARQVKLRDIEHNTKVTRLKGISLKDLKRVGKYHRAYTYLKSV